MALKRMIARHSIGFACLLVAGCATAWDAVEAGYKAREQGRYAEAEKAFKAVLEEAEKSGRLSPQKAVARHALAGLYLDQGKAEEAMPHAAGAVAVTMKIHGPQHPNVVLGLTRLAEVHIALREYADAERASGRALAIRRTTAPGPDQHYAYNLTQFANALWGQQRYDQAEPQARRAHWILSNTVAPGDPRLLYTLVTLARILYSQRKYPEAQSLAEQALAIQEKIRGPEHLDLASTLYILARLREAQGKKDEAEALVKRVLSIKEKELGPRHRDLAIALDRLAALARERGGSAEAESYSQRAAALPGGRPSGCPG